MALGASVGGVRGSGASAWRAWWRPRRSSWAGAPSLLTSSRGSDVGTGGGPVRTGRRRVVAARDGDVGFRHDGPAKRVRGSGIDAPRAVFLPRKGSIERGEEGHPRGGAAGFRSPCTRNGHWTAASRKEHENGQEGGRTPTRRRIAFACLSISGHKPFLNVPAPGRRETGPRGDGFPLAVPVRSSSSEKRVTRAVSQP